MRFVLLFVSAVALWECGKQCTLILCRETLTLEVRTTDGGVPERLRGQITVEGDVLSFACPPEGVGSGDYDCSPGTVVVDLNLVGVRGMTYVGDPLPASLPLTIEVPDAGLSWSGTLTPAYTTFEANGPGCGECSRGTERVTLEAR
ncbi:MAG: hypothetical protein JNK82_17230 [Myxococcaceae bacterium]|nr:hypothetical protein [Myxococcaceae bacterium]